MNIHYRNEYIYMFVHNMMFMCAMYEHVRTPGLHFSAEKGRMI